MEQVVDSIFHRTPEGERASRRSDAWLPDAHRVVLACLDAAIHFDGIAAQLAPRSGDEIARCLEDLEAIGLVESIPLEWLVDLYTLCWGKLGRCPRAEVRA